MSQKFNTPFRREDRVAAKERILTTFSKEQLAKCLSRLKIKRA
jgi:hypothetical protein